MVLIHVGSVMMLTTSETTSTGMLSAAQRLGDITIGVVEVRFTACRHLCFLLAHGKLTMGEDIHTSTTGGNMSSVLARLREMSRHFGVGMKSLWRKERLNCDVRK
jgi:hypothetical protein